MRLALPRLANGVPMHGHRALDTLDECDARQLREKEFGRVPHPVRNLRVHHVVIEVDARRTPHHDLVGRVPLEQLERPLRHAFAGGRVALAVVHDAAAIRRAADGDVVELEQIEHGGDGADHV